MITPLADEYAFYDDAKCTLKSGDEGGRLIVRLDDDKTLGRELRIYPQTDKYVGRKNDGTASMTTLKILRERQEENRERRQRLVLQLEQLCKEAGHYAAGQPVSTPSKWRRIIIIKRQTVDKGQLQAARDLAKDVFGRIAPPTARKRWMAFCTIASGGGSGILASTRPWPTPAIIRVARPSRMRSK